MAWLVVFVVLSVFFLMCAIYHSIILPRPQSDHAPENVTASNLMAEFFSTLQVVLLQETGFGGYRLHVAVSFA